MENWRLLWSHWYCYNFPSSQHPPNKLSHKLTEISVFAAFASPNTNSWRNLKTGNVNGEQNTQTIFFNHIYWKILLFIWTEKLFLKWLVCVSPKSVLSSCVILIAWFMYMECHTFNRNPTTAAKKMLLKNPRSRDCEEKS